MKKYIVQVVDSDGCIDERYAPERICGENLAEQEIIRRAIKNNPSLRNVLEEEPQNIIYDAQGSIINAKDISDALYIIIVPVQGDGGTQ